MKIEKTTAKATGSQNAELNENLRLHELTDAQIETLDAQWHALNPDVIDCDSIRTRINNNREWMITIAEFLTA